MITLILSLHIMAATAMTVATILVFVAAYIQRQTRAYRPMLVSFGATALSGIGLLFVAAGGLGRFCVMMSGFALAVIAAHVYYRARVAA